MNNMTDNDPQRPAMRYESIALHAFDNSKAEDAEGIMNAAFFKANFVPTLTTEGLHAMYAIIDRLIGKTTDPDKMTDYYGVRNTLEVGMEPETSIPLLDYVFEMMNAS